MGALSPALVCLSPIGSSYTWFDPLDNFVLPAVILVLVYYLVRRRSKHWLCTRAFIICAVWLGAGYIASTRVSPYQVNLFSFHALYSGVGPILGFIALCFSFNAFRRLAESETRDRYKTRAAVLSIVLFAVLFVVLLLAFCFAIDYARLFV